MRYVNLLIQLLIMVVLVSCSGQESGESQNEMAEEAPFFEVDRNATGPLTLTELQINIPKEIRAEYTEDRRSCFFESVKRRALEAGAPASLNPNDFPYWNGKLSRADWSRQSNYMKRLLLAQAILSWAMVDC